MTQTILLTGASGFIAKHIAVAVLNAGYRLRASLRSPGRADEVRNAVRPHLTDPAGADRIDFVSLDLGDDAGWNAAMTGVDALLHTASPFPLAQPRDPQALIRPAVDGTLRALRAAHSAGVGRVVLTSSVAAIAASDLPPGRSAHDERDWSDPDHPLATPYFRSKLMAERAAWAFRDEAAPEMALTVLNPVLVLGPALDGYYGSSLQVVERVLAGRDPMLPRVGFPVVDVRDVAQAHLRALERPESAGQRILLADRFLWFRDLADLLRKAYPDRRIPSRTAPDLLIRALSLFDPTIRAILPSLGLRQEVSAQRARQVLGIDFIPAEEAVRAAAASVIAAKG